LLFGHHSCTRQLLAPGIMLGGAAGEQALGPAYCAHSAPHYPVATRSRVRVDGWGAGTYVAFAPRLLGRHRHTIDFDAGGRRTLTSDRLLARAWGNGAGLGQGAGGAAAGWAVAAEGTPLGSVLVNAFPSAEPVAVPLSAGLSHAGLRAAVAERLGVELGLSLIVAL
jgi:hypothetical protein